MIRTGSFVIGSLFILTVSLVLLGVIMVLSSSQFIFSHSFRGNVYEYMGRQLIWFSVGLAGLAFFYLCDYNLWERNARWIMLAACLLLALVFSPLGHEVNGGRRWVRLLGFNFQPSDFSKVAVIIYLAAVWADRSEQLASFLKGVFFPMLLVGFSLVMIVLEPDHGTAFFIGLVALVIWFAAGGRLMHMVPMFFVLTTSIIWAIYQKPHLYDRIRAYWHPEIYRDSKYYQVFQSLIGFAHGGWWGVGWGEGVQQLGFTPFPHTDCIFSIMGEELGFVKCSLVLLAYLAIVLFGLGVALHCSNPFGRLLAVGCTTALGLQAGLNIAVVTGSIPTTGVALPLISYGGSSLTITMSMMGLLMSVAKDAYFAGGNNPERKRGISRHSFVH